MKNLFQNKKILFTLILMASCLGILGMIEKSEAAGVDVEVHFLKAGAGEVSSAEVGEEIIIQIVASATHSPIINKPFEIDINGSSYKCNNMTGGNCKFGVAGGGVKCTCEKLFSFPSDGDYKITGTVYSNGNKSYSKSKTITIGNVPAQLPLSANTTSATSTTPASSINVQAPATTSAGSTVNLPTKKLSKILEDLIKWLLQIVILIAILMIIISGTMYMISAGDQQKADTAKKALTYAIFGLLVVALAYAIVSTLVKILAG